MKSIRQALLCVHYILQILRALHQSAMQLS